jgi:hypothetical protein
MKIVVEYQTGDEQVGLGVLTHEEEALFCLWAESVYRERVKQIAKWGDQRHADDTGGKMLAAQAEIARRACVVAAEYVLNDEGVGDPGWRLIMEEEVAEAFAERGGGPGSDGGRALCGELVQVAAVGAAWWSDVKRRVK